MEIFGNVFNEYSYVPSSAFEADKDSLPIIKKAVSDDIGAEVGTVRSISIYSDDSFTVQLNEETKLVSISDGSVYKVSFTGMVTECTFEAETEASYVQIAY